MNGPTYLILLKSPEEVEILYRTAQEEGLSPKKLENVLIVHPKNNAHMLEFLNEIDVELLKGMKMADIEEGEGITCERALAALSKAKTAADVLDELIYNEIGTIFSKTKVVFHPIVDVRKKRVFAMEALCRPPLHIVDLMNIGRSTARFSDSFCRDQAIKNTAKKLPKDVKLFINFHPKFLENPLKDFGELIASLLTYGVNPDRIVVELTEYEKLKLEAVKNLISFLKTEGVMVALDDIGSGYSGLFYLSELRPDFIKIDMELVRNLHRDDFKKVIVNHLIEIAHKNGIRVVCEGIESQDELRQVVLMETDYIQGYIITKPTEKPNIKEINEKVKLLLGEIT